MDQIHNLLLKIKSMVTSNHPIIIAIDGRCGSGKTTLALYLQRELGCSVIHMDDFFPRPEQRTEARFKTPGGNVDYERVESEVLQPLRQGLCAVFYPFDCTRMQLSNVRKTIPVGDIIIVEGSYSCHPQLWDYYDLHIFSDITPDLQICRIVARNGKEKAQNFSSRWIPFEELYFSSYNIKEKCDICIEASNQLDLRI